MNDIASVMGGAFRPDSVDGAADGFEPLPAGWYPVDIDSAEMTETNAKDGYYIGCRQLYSVTSLLVASCLVTSISSIRIRLPLESASESWLRLALR